MVYQTVDVNLICSLAIDLQQLQFTILVIKTLAIVYNRASNMTKQFDCQTQWHMDVSYWCIGMFIDTNISVSEMD